MKVNIIVYKNNPILLRASRCTMELMNNLLIDPMSTARIIILLEQMELHLAEMARMMGGSMEPAAFDIRQEPEPPPVVTARDRAIAEMRRMKGGK